MPEKATSQQLQNIIDSLGNTVSINGFKHPEIDPVFFSIAGLELRWYSLAYLFGIIFGYILCNYLNNNHSTKKINEKAIENLPLWVILSIILGGRIGYVLFYNFEYYLNNPAEILQVWQGGMAFHGGVIGVIIGIFVFSKMYREKFLQVTDLIAVVCPIGLFLGRCANFINMELVGRKCEYYQWCVIYPNENFARYPSQIFEAATEGVLLLLIMLVLAIKFKILNRTGYASAIFLMLYAVFRFACEFFREPDVQLGFIIEEITMGQVLSVFMFTIGLAVYFVSAKLLKQNKI